MYKAKLSGSTSNSRGKVYRFTAGKPVKGAEKGELDHCKSVEWQAPKRKKSSKKGKSSKKEE